MSITAENKKKVIEKFAIEKGDTGSPQVQIAILTERINNLTGHFKAHKKDFTKLVYLEKIYVGNRIRDIKYDFTNRMFILSLQDSNQIGFLFNDERKN